MGICGRYIDSRPVEDRDALIVGELNDGGNTGTRQCGCLIGIAEATGYSRYLEMATERAFLMWKIVGARVAMPFYSETARRHETLTGRDERISNWYQVSTMLTPTGWSPYYRYPALVQRFGHARVARAVKLRAARGNAPTIVDSARTVPAIALLTSRPLSAIL